MQFAVGDIVCIDPHAVMEIIDSGEWRDVPYTWTRLKGYLGLLSNKSWKIVEELPYYSKAHFPDEKCWRIESIDDKSKLPDYWEIFEESDRTRWSVPSRILILNYGDEPDQKLIMKGRFDKIRHDIYISQNM